MFNPLTTKTNAKTFVWYHVLKRPMNCLVIIFLPFWKSQQFVLTEIDNYPGTNLLTQLTVPRPTLLPKSSKSIWLIVTRFCIMLPRHLMMKGEWQQVCNHTIHWSYHMLHVEAYRMFKQHLEGRAQGPPTGWYPIRMEYTRYFGSVAIMICCSVSIPRIEVGLGTKGWEYEWPLSLLILQIILRICAFCSC